MSITKHININRWNSEQAHRALCMRYRGLVIAISAFSPGSWICSKALPKEILLFLTRLQHLHWLSWSLGGLRATVKTWGLSLLEELSCQLVPTLLSPWLFLASMKTFYSSAGLGCASFSGSSAPFCHWPVSLGNFYRPHPVQDHSLHSEKNPCKWAGGGGGGVWYPDLHQHSPESCVVASKNPSFLLLM